MGSSCAQLLGIWWYMFILEHLLQRDNVANRAKTRFPVGRSSWQTSLDPRGRTRDLPTPESTFCIQRWNFYNVKNSTLFALFKKTHWNNMKHLYNMFPTKWHLKNPPIFSESLSLCFTIIFCWPNPSLQLSAQLCSCRMTMLLASVALLRATTSPLTMVKTSSPGRAGLAANFSSCLVGKKPT